MGNKLCGPLLKKAYRHEDYPWHIRKDSHLLRLWAEIFRVQGDGEGMRWKRVSEDVVPINISCVEDNPDTVFQVTAYNRHVEKIFDVKIVQPGTIICPATESFVHWRDSAAKVEWGLNFTTPSDAKRFRDCCTNPAQKFSRKASSASSLRLSPPKVRNRIKGKDTSISSPNSPVHHNKRTVSSPFELGFPDTCDHLTADIDLSQPDKKEKSATIPRTAADSEQDAQLFKPTGILKPPSSSSVYDNVTNAPARKSNETETNVNNRKSMPAVGTTHVSFVVDNLLQNTRPASAIQFTEQYYQTQYDNECTPCQKGPGRCSSATLPAGISKTCENVRMETAFVGDSSKSCQGLSYCGNHGDSVTVLSPQAVKPGTLSQKTSSSESPEWPSPPEPLTPMTPVNPMCNVDFDSSVLKRMLQSLPVSPEEVDLNKDQGFHDDPVLRENPKTDDPEMLKRAKSFTSRDRSEVRAAFAAQHSVSIAPSQDRPQGHSKLVSTKSKQTKLLIENELRLRNKCARESYGRDSYPDSGIGGMTGDTAGSVWSSDSVKASSNITGLEVGSTKTGGSSGGSSHDSSSSGRHSDIINQLGEGTDIKQFMSPEFLDDDGAESDDSIHTMTEAESHISHKKFGAIRKAGWLVVKNWLIQRKRKLELAPKRKWKRYWVCLKGTVLLFFDCDEETLIDENTIPRHILVIEGGITQAVPEHPKRDNIFSLSTAFGDAYLFQALSPTEVDSWICAVHSACASAFARQHGKDNTLRLMKSELHKLETNIDVDVKMKKMAELQLTVVKDPRSRQAIIKQIGQWEENLEKLFIEQYRLRCYISSLQGTELPNPKVLLASASKVTKTTLGRLGIFTVTSFHALVCARKPLVVPNIYGKGHHKGGMLSPRGDGTFKYNIKTSPTKSCTTDGVYKATDFDEVVADLYKDIPDGISDKSEESAIMETLSRIALPNNQELDNTEQVNILVGVDKKTSVQHLLESVCSKRQLNPSDHYVRIKMPNAPQGNYYIPDMQDNIKKLKYESIEVCQKSVFQLDLQKNECDTEFGFAVEAELAEDIERDDELRLYVSNVLQNGIAHRTGLIIGDEILVINGKIVSELDMVYIEAMLHESMSLCLTVRSLRTQPPPTSVAVDPADINRMVCPPPPSQSRISEKSLGKLTVPAPVANGDHKNTTSPKHESMPNLSPTQIDALLESADQVTAICRTGSDNTMANNMDSVHNYKPLSESQKLRKVIMELIETERAYVKDLNFLTERYLEPLKQETCLTSNEIDQLFGNIQEIVIFQRQFLKSLEEAMQLEDEFFTTEDPKNYRDLELRRVLFSLGGSFLFYANHFKVYSSFCASHTRSQKILNPDANEALRKFLHVRNPKQQHSSTLESYLIKPIQRILRYPLLLQQLCNLTDADTDEHYHLSEALKGMEAVAEHINEMQKIYEEYGAVFDELSRMFRDLYPHKKAVELSVGELQMYGTVEWCNICDSLGKIKKGLDLENIIFVFKSAVVFLCREKVKKKKGKNQANKGTPETHECVERFRTLIPVTEVQVQGGKVSDMDKHYWWELVHSRSDKEGRPERVYQFCNSSTEAKSDFMKIIRQTIRESVRKMTLPQGGNGKTSKNYIPYGGKRLEGLVGSNVRTLRKKQANKILDGERHSMELDGKVNLLEGDSFRTRSKTVGDLNVDDLDNESQAETYVACSEPQISADSKSSCSSNSNLSTSSRNSGSAKLTFASANPVTHSSSSISCDDGGSPVWKPRHETIYGPKLSPPSSSVSSKVKSYNKHIQSDKASSDILFKVIQTLWFSNRHLLVGLKILSADTDCQCDSPWLKFLCQLFNY
ncbi:protein still life, isoform SIF type 1-like isoform X2 [Pecten maximus]|uniref:protein still life, isoform SIF type 1-like isoform X2 n=1 Tax=Pecten maximus TaxID=6579 RepID=UPI001458583D|nr:protein still life, isoform SIF type 1-like isoform X2 [Pecten maximus]